MRYLAILLLLALATGLFAARGDDVDWLPGVVVFKLSEACDPANIDDACCGVTSVDRQLAALGVTEVRQRFVCNEAKAHADAPDLSRIVLARFDERYPVPAVAELLSRYEQVLWAEPQYRYHTLATPDDPYFDDSPFLAAMQAEQAWDIHRCADNPNPPIIAIADTGTRWDHPDLADAIWNNLGEDTDGDSLTFYFDGDDWIFDPDDLNGVDDDGNGYVDDLIGWNFMADLAGTQNNDPYDAGVHGTRVSGLAAMTTDNATGGSSIPWGARLMPLSCSPEDAPWDIFNGFDAVIYAAENGADVINCSWGGKYYSYAGDEAVAYAHALGAVVVCACGNSNNDTPLYPSAYPHTVAVASLHNNGEKWDVSTYGWQVDVGAPCDTMRTTDQGSYSVVNRFTSYASPVAAGLAALIASQHPTWSADEIIAQLCASCDDVDALNPGLENMLGEGLLNAYRALSETNPQPDNELRLALRDVRPPSDADGEGAIEPGETFSLNLTVQNWSLASEDVTCTLVSNSADATVLSASESLSIPSDGYATLEDAFLVQVAPGAASQYLNFTLTISSATPILTDSVFTVKALVNGGGCLVWESVQNARNQSGWYIKGQLESLGETVVHGVSFPHSLQGFNSVWLCFGTPGGALQPLDHPWMSDAICDYLLSGGRLFIEGGDVIAYDMPLLPVGGDTLSSDVLWPLLGIDDASDGEEHQLTGLSGEHGWLAQGMAFDASNQYRYSSIDTYTPGEDGVEVFREAGLGVTAVQAIGAYGQRSVVCSYAIRELVDGDAPNTRSELIARIHDFFVSDSLALPAVDSLRITATGDSLRLLWGYPFPVDGYDVMSADAPDGDFTTFEAQTTATEAILNGAEHAKRFYRVLARRVFGVR